MDLRPPEFEFPEPSLFGPPCPEEGFSWPPDILDSSDLPLLEDEGAATTAALQVLMPEEPAHFEESGSQPNESSSDQSREPNSETMATEKRETEEESSPRTSPVNPQPSPRDEDEEFVVSKKEEEEDEDFTYSKPKRTAAQYKKRKDVVCKTILRKCRRLLQDKFNGLTGYLDGKKGKDGSWYKECLVKFLETEPML